MRCERCNKFFTQGGRGPMPKRFCSEYCRKQSEKKRANRRKHPNARRTPSTYGKSRQEIEDAYHFKHYPYKSEGGAK